MNALLLFLCLILPLQAQELNLRAPNQSFDFIDQKNGVGNSCGPASILNAFGSGSKEWQIPFKKIPATSDRTRISSVIRSWGQVPSNTLPGRKRWEIKGGSNFVDLTVMANEMRKLHWKLPKLKSELFFATPGPKSEISLNQAHKRLQKSLKKGFPPLLSIRRFVLRKGQWQSVHGHFVVLTAMPDKLTRGTRTFPIEFVDPIGAKTYRAEITASDRNNTLPSLILSCPSNAIGKSQVKSGEQHALGLTGAIGSW